MLALTANPFYSLGHAKPGLGVAGVMRTMKVGKPFHIGLNTWYIAAGVSANGVLKVRGGIIQEVGLANKQLTQTRTAQRRFLTSFNRTA